MIVRAVRSIAAAAVLILVLPPAARAQAAAAQPAATPPPAQTAAQALAQAAPPTFEGRPIKVYLRAGLKTHAAGQHDYPQFLADWSKLLTERGAIVDGSLHFPTEQELADVDVIVMHKGDAGYMTIGERIALENFGAAAAWSGFTTPSVPTIRCGGPASWAAPRSTARRTSRSKRRSPTRSPTPTIRLRRGRPASRSPTRRSS